MNNSIELTFLGPELRHPKKKEDRPASYIRKEFQVKSGLRLKNQASLEKCLISSGFHFVSAVM